jgi:hypothetical protein
MTTFRNRSNIPSIVPSHSIPDVNEIQKSTVEHRRMLREYRRCFTVQELSSRWVVHQVLMVDQIATEEELNGTQDSNFCLGVCREHGKNISLEFNNEIDVEERLLKSLDDLKGPKVMGMSDLAEEVWTRPSVAMSDL